MQALAWLVTAIFTTVGALFAAFMTGFVSPYWCFGLYAIFAIVVIMTSLCMSPQLEFENDFDLARSMSLNGVHIGRRRTFWEETRHNYHIVKHEFKMGLF